MAKRRRRRRKRKHGWGAKKATHRTPPLPDWFVKAEPGRCRWCGQPILRPDGTVNTRRLWHPKPEFPCLHEYFIVTRPSYAKRQVKKRDKGVCAGCGTYCHYRHEWECDHIVELADAPRELKYWQLGNLQTLCIKCHDEKSAANRTARAQQRKKKN